jgi:hypothetical protein
VRDYRIRLLGHGFAAPGVRMGLMLGRV